MLDKTPQAGQILISQLHGEAKHHARWRELTEDEHAAAVDAIRELAGGRADLLAHVAGILEGAGEGQPDEPLARQAAGLCRDAGADPEAIAGWAEIGRQRRADARRLPFSGGLRRRPSSGGTSTRLSNFTGKTYLPIFDIGSPYVVPCFHERPEDQAHGGDHGRP